MGGCLRGCLLILLAPLLLVFLPVLIAGAILYAMGRLFLGLWQSNLPLRTKRAITGVLFYPAAVYFMYRYTGYQVKVKRAFVVAAVATTVIAAQVLVLLPPLAALMGVVFLLLFLAEAGDFETVPASVTISPTRRPLSARPVVPTADLRRLLEIEESSEGAERRLLLAREFNRLATEVCGPAPLDRAGWPDRERLAVLREEIDLLRASASDTPAALPDPADDQLSYADLRSAIDGLRGYVGLMLSVESSGRNEPEQLRLMTRERGRIQRVQEDLIERLQG